MIIKRVIKILRRLFRKKSPEPIELKQNYFDQIILRPKTPANDEVEEGIFVKVQYKGKPYWCLFRCPCGCKKVITLSLQENHSPHWEIKVSESGRPSLFPSVWQNSGCLSHFWIDEGKVIWCGNSGIEPWVAEPEFYSEPGSGS